MSETTRRLPLQNLTKRHLWVPLVAVGLLFGLGFLLQDSMGQIFFGETAGSSASQTDSVPPLPVNVQTIEYVDFIEQTRAYTGTIRARNLSDLAFEFSGKINEFIDGRKPMGDRKPMADEGDIVKKGAVIASLDTETLTVQQQAIEASLAQAKSLMEELIAGPRLETIAAAKASKEAAQSLFDNTVENRKRREDLYRAGAISDEEYDQARFAEQTAKSNLDAARQRWEELKSGTRQEKIDAQRAAVRQLESSVREIEVAIGKSELVAPFDGVITRRYLDPGSIAQASEPVFKLVEHQHMEAWVGFPVSIAAELKKGSVHDLWIDGKVYEQVATVSAKIRELDPATRTQTVLFTLTPESSSRVVSGQLCKIHVTSRVEETGVWIPTSALVKGVRGLWSVMVMVSHEDGYRTERRDIQIIKTGNNRVLAKGTIESDEQVVVGILKKGDQIVANGVHRIAEGQHVVPATE